MAQLHEVRLVSAPEISKADLKKRAEDPAISFLEANFTRLIIQRDQDQRYHLAADELRERLSTEGGCVFTGSAKNELGEILDFYCSYPTSQLSVSEHVIGNPDFVQTDSTREQFLAIRNIGYDRLTIIDEITRGNGVIKHMLGVQDKRTSSKS